MADEDSRPPCKYGGNCYRLNEEHKVRFSHPPKNQSAEQNESNDTDRNRSPRPSEHDQDVNTRPPAKRPKTVSSDENDSDIDEAALLEVNDPTGIESTSNGDGINDNGGRMQASSSQSDDNFRAPIATTAAQPSVRCSEYINESFDKGPHAQRAEHQQLLDSPAQFIHSKFLVNMPSDFAEFWSFCVADAQPNSKPEDLFDKFGLRLVGPFDVLAKKFHDIEPFEPGEYLRHWRFFYDPPEFQVSTNLYNCLPRHIHKWRSLF